MFLNFEKLYESLMVSCLTEAIEYSKLKKLNIQINYIEKKVKDVSEKRKQLKELSKELILHITNNNYENILNTSDLIELKKIAGKLTDDEFKPHLINKLSNLTSINYENFWKQINNKIISISNKNNHEFENLKKLRPQYLMNF